MRTDVYFQFNIYFFKKNISSKLYLHDVLNESLLSLTNILQHDCNKYNMTTTMRKCYLVYTNHS